MATNFSDKIILVTGGTSGIGLSTVINFVKQNAKKVYTCGRNLTNWKIALILIKKELGENYRRIEFIQTDIRVECEVKHLIKTIFKNEHQLDVIVNNAGVNIPPVKIWEQNFGITRKINDKEISYTFYSDGEPGDSRQTPMFTMVYGLLFCLKWQLHYILKYNDVRKQVNIVNVSSIFEYVTAYPEYISAKAATIELTKCIAGQVSEQKFYNDSTTPKILINSISPGAVITPLYLKNFNVPIVTAIENTKSRTPLNRIATSEDIANYILVLSDCNITTFLQGSNVVIDGGMSAIPNYNRTS